MCIAVRDALGDLDAGDLVLVACSGGPDSLALAAATARMAPRPGLRAGAVAVDHGWSAEASAAARGAAEQCRSLGLDPVHLVAVEPTGPGGPEASAREARYGALDAVAEELGAAAVLLGHTLDDQAETVLLGLARGSGARSLAGMALRRGRYRRPFLDLERRVTAQACAELGLTPWSDPANADPSYARARVRAAAGTLEEALGPGLAAALARTADLLREDADALDALGADLLAAADPAASGDLDPALLRAAPTAVRRRAMLAAARAAGCPAGALSRAHAVALDALLAGGGSRSTHLPGGVVARVEYGRLRLASPQSRADDTGRE